MRSVFYYFFQKSNAKDLKEKEMALHKKLTENAVFTILQNTLFFNFPVSTLFI
jgi:hypothetical protein